MEDQEQAQLTAKQRKWLESYLKSGNATLAALEAYYPDFPFEKEHKDLTEKEEKIYDTASVTGYENLRNAKMSDIMEQAGLTDKFLLDKLAEGLDSTKQLGVRLGKDATAGTDDFVEVEDMPTRHKYLDSAFKLKGKYVEKIDLTTGGKPLITLDTKPDENK